MYQMPGVVTQLSTLLDVPWPVLLPLLGWISTGVSSLPAVCAARVYQTDASLDPGRPSTRRRMGSGVEDAMVGLRCCTSARCRVSRIRWSESLHAAWLEHDSLDASGGSVGPEAGGSYLRRENAITYSTLGTTYGVVYVPIGYQSTDESRGRLVSMGCGRSGRSSEHAAYSRRCKVESTARYRSSSTSRGSHPR